MVLCLYVRFCVELCGDFAMQPVKTLLEFHCKHIRHRQACGWKETSLRCSLLLLHKQTAFIAICPTLTLRHLLGAPGACSLAPLTLSKEQLAGLLTLCGDSLSALLSSTTSTSLGKCMKEIDYRSAHHSIIA